MDDDDQIRSGNLTAEQLQELVQRVADLGELAGRVSALEENASGDGAAFPALVEVTPEGDVTNIESEVVNELVSEEGDIIIGGKGGKAKTLHRGKTGQILKVGPDGVLEWGEGGEESFARGTAELNSGSAEVDVGFEPSMVFLQPHEGEIEDPENPGQAPTLSVHLGAHAPANGFLVTATFLGEKPEEEEVDSSFFWLAFA